MDYIKPTIDEFISELKPTIKSHDYFVDWEKVKSNVFDFKINLGIMSALLGETDFENKFKELIKKYPECASVLPLLVAVRFNGSDLNIIDDLEQITTYNFNKIKTVDNDLADKYYRFAKETGIEKLFVDKEVTNLMDYVFGVEVGLDTNARKNRTGKSMEDKLENVLKAISEENQEIEYITQATASQIKKAFGIDINVDKNNRKFDFAVKNGNGHLTIVEVNFYEGGGSKLKATAGEYKTIEDLINSQNHTFVWITDGFGWKTAKNPLEETINHNNYVLNLKMVSDGLLERIILK
ncbi:type II restriction endonuclease [Methanococcus sp. CF]